jgi:hypothetical protein
MLFLGVFADDPLPYPFGPFEEAADARRAARLERTYAGEGGTALALQQTCAGSNMFLRVPDLVARNFLIARADRTYPRLLDRLARSAARDDEWECAPPSIGASALPRGCRRSSVRLAAEPWKPAFCGQSEGARVDGKRSYRAFHQLDFAALNSLSIPLGSAQ